jgi:DNA-binding MarR family transcriptional regulator
VSVSDHEIDAAASLRTSVTKLARMARSEGQRHDVRHLPSGLLSALSALEQHGSMSPGELAIKESVRKSSMTRLVQALVQNEYVRREPHPTDGRSDLLVITDEGVKALQLSRDFVDGWYLRRIEQLSKPERRALIAALPALRKLAEMPLEE